MNKKSHALDIRSTGPVNKNNNDMSCFYHGVIESMQHNLSQLVYAG